MKRITYINGENKKITRECFIVRHYKNYVMLIYDGEYNGRIMQMREDIKHENIIKEEEVK